MVAVATRPSASSCLCLVHTTDFSPESEPLWPVLAFTWTHVFNLSFPHTKLQKRRTTWPHKATFAVGASTIRARPPGFGPTLAIVRDVVLVEPA